jgi:predicted transposase/invertase (TIGR01784 family)
MTDNSHDTPIAVDIQKIYDETLHSLNELANKSYDDPHVYALSLKQHRDFINAMDTAKKEAKNEGREAGKFLEKLETATTMLEKGFDIKMIIEITKLTEEIILQKLLNKKAE